MKDDLFSALLEAFVTALLIVALAALLILSHDGGRGPDVLIVP